VGNQETVTGSITILGGMREKGHSRQDDQSFEGTARTGESNPSSGEVIKDLFYWYSKGREGKTGDPFKSGS